MTRKILLTALIALVVPAAAQAHTTIIEPEGSHFPYQRWVDEAKVPTPNVTLTLIQAPCPGLPRVESCYVRAANTIWMNLQVHGAFPRQTLYHELGHSAEPSFGVNARHWFRALRGHTKLPWVVVGGWGLQEVFAETYAACAFGRLMAGWFKNTATPFSPRICNFIRRALLD